jgi:hypothetical protein
MQKDKPVTEKGKDLFESPDTSGRRRSCISRLDLDFHRIDKAADSDSHRSRTVLE